MSVSIQSGQPNKVHPELETAVELRKLFGKWELYIQCNGSGSSKPLPSERTGPSDIRGFEAITIMHPESNARVCITPSGKVFGLSVPANLEVHTSINETGWLARMVLPTTWVEGDRFSFSIVRTHGDSTQVETGPLPCVPWSINPEPIHIDLSAWDTVDNFPISLPIE